MAVSYTARPGGINPKNLSRAVLIPPRTETMYFSVTLLDYQSLREYEVVMSLWDFCRLTEVQPITADGKSGYQRMPILSHYLRYGAHLLDMPRKLNFYHGRTPQCNFIGLELDRDGRLPIYKDQVLDLLDGGHFKYALEQVVIPEWAKATKGSDWNRNLTTLLFDIPLTVRIGDNWDLQTCRQVVFDMNANARKMSSNVTSLIAGQQEGYLSPTGQKAYYAALALAHDYEDSPFYHKVDFQTSPSKKHGTLISFKTLMDGISTHVKLLDEGTSFQACDLMIQLFRPALEMFPDPQFLYTTAIFNGVLMSQDLLPQHWSTLRRRLPDGLVNLKTTGAGISGAKAVMEKIRLIVLLSEEEQKEEQEQEPEDQDPFASAVA